MKKRSTFYFTNVLLACIFFSACNNNDAGPAEMPVAPTKTEVMNIPDTTSSKRAIADTTLKKEGTEKEAAEKDEPNEKEEKK